jgi:hypothetical protein
MIYGKKKILKRDEKYEDSITDFYISVFKLFRKNNLSRGQLIGFSKDLNNDLVEILFGIKTEVKIEADQLDRFNIDNDITRDFFQTVNCYIDEEKKPANFDKVYLESSRD